MNFLKKLFSPQRAQQKKCSVATGCKSGKGCQHMDLGKAKNAGKADNITFCRHCNGFVERRDSCEHYYPRGCASGICSYATQKNGAVYCSRYQTTLPAKESCPEYLDFFDTEDGKDIFACLK